MEKKCPHCGSKHINKHAKKVLVDRKRQRYQCMDCGRTFYLD